MTSPHMMSVVMTLSTYYLSADKDYMRRLPKNRTQAPRATQCDLLDDQDQATTNIVDNRSPGALVSSYGRLMIPWPAKHVHMIEAGTQRR
jgi:hypothetical protein